MSEGAPSRNPEGPQTERGLLRTLGDYSALIAIAAAAIYVLGLFSLLVPIMTTYDAGFTTAWYSVSLVPRNIVAGQGFKQLLLGPVMYFVAFLIAYTVSAVIRLIRAKRAHERTPDEAGRALWLDRIQQLIAIITAVLSVSGTFTFLEPLAKNFLSVTQSFLSSLPVAALVSALIALAAPIAVGLLIGAYAGWVRGPGTGIMGAIRIAPSVRSPILAGLAVAFLAAYVIAGFRDPPLPTTEITWDKGSTTGELLTHVEGFWYVFNDDNRLVAIPDDKVDKVRLPRP